MAGTMADSLVVKRVDSWVVSMAALKGCLMADWMADSMAVLWAVSMVGHWAEKMVGL